MKTNNKIKILELNNKIAKSTETLNNNVKKYQKLETEKINLNRKIEYYQNFASKDEAEAIKNVLEFKILISESILIDNKMNLIKAENELINEIVENLLTLKEKIN